MSVLIVIIIGLESLCVRKIVYLYILSLIHSANSYCAPDCMSAFQVPCTKEECDMVPKILEVGETLNSKIAVKLF